MRLLLIILICLITLTAFNWVNSNQFSIGDLMPFSSRQAHSGQYNCLAMAMIAIAGWCLVGRLYGRKR